MQGCITVEWKQLHLMHLILTDTCLKVMGTLDSCIPCQSLHRQAVGCWLWRASNVTQLCNNWRRGLQFTALERRSRSCRGHPWHQATCHFPRLFLGLYWPRSELNVIHASYHDDAHRKSRQITCIWTCIWGWFCDYKAQFTIWRCKPPLFHHEIGIDYYFVTCNLPCYSLVSDYTCFVWLQYYLECTHKATPNWLLVSGPFPSGNSMGVGGWLGL